MASRGTSILNVYPLGMSCYGEWYFQRQKSELFIINLGIGEVGTQSSSNFKVALHSEEKPGSEY